MHLVEIVKYFEDVAQLFKKSKAQKPSINNSKTRSG